MQGTNDRDLFYNNNNNNNNNLLLVWSKFACEYDQMRRILIIYIYDEQYL